MNRLIRLAVAVAAFAPAAASVLGSPASAPTVFKAGGGTLITVANLEETLPANIVADLYRQDGGRPVALSLPQVAPGRAWDTDLARETRVPPGTYAGLMWSDWPVSALARLSWGAGAGTAAYDSPVAGTDVVVPDLRRGTATSSLVTLQNVDPDHVSTVTFTLNGDPEQGNAQVLTKQYTVQAGASITLDLQNDADFAAVPPGEYWARATASGPLAAMALLGSGPDERAVTAYNGVPVERLGRTWHLPALHARWGGSTLDTVAYLLNPGATEVTATAGLIGIDGPCRGRSFTWAPPGLRAGGWSRLAVDDLLGAGCLASGTVHANGDIVVYAYSVGGDRLAAAYDAVSPLAAGRRLTVPYWHTDAAGGSAVFVQNTGGAAATVNLAWHDRSGQTVAGCGASCSAQVPPGAGQAFDAVAVPRIGPDQAGSVVVTADQPLAVVVLDQSMDQDLTAYTVPAVPELGPPPGRIPLPLAMKDRTGDSATATPRPATPTPGRPSSDLAEPASSSVSVTHLGGPGTLTSSLGLTGPDGRPATPFSLPPLAPDQTYSVDLRDEDRVAAGVYSANVGLTGAPAGLVARSEWPASRAATMYNAPRPGTEVIVAQLNRSRSLDTDYRRVYTDSILTVQATTMDAQTQVEVALIRHHSVTPDLVVPLIVAPGGSASLDLDADPLLGSLPDNWTGWAVVRAPTPVTVLATHWSSGVYTTLGVPREHAARDWVVPMVPVGLALARQVDLLSSLRIVNPGPSTANIQVTYHPVVAAANGRDCPTTTRVHRLELPSLEPGALRTIDPSVTAGIGGCVVSARIRAGAPVVVEASLLQARAYRDAVPAIAAGEGGRRVSLPVVRNGHTSLKLTTAIQVVNMGDAAAHVSLAVALATGSAACAACQAVIAPGAGQLWWPPDILDWPVNGHGSAVVTGDQPLAVTVVDMSMLGNYDAWDVAVYRGLTPELDAPLRHLPLLLRHGILAGVPTRPTPAPTFTPQPTATSVTQHDLYFPWAQSSAP